MTFAKVCTTYYQVKKCKKRFSVNQGGTRSGKSISIIQVLIEFAYTNKQANITITIVRKSSPSLKGTIYRDFINILKSEGMYSDRYHNKTDKTYLLFGNVIQFLAVDEAQKIRGRQHDIVYMNEANELTLDDFVQLNMRTTTKVIIDYNPSFLEHEWIDSLIARTDNCEFNITTYKDNPTLPPAQIKEIEALEQTNPNLWTIYGLGKRAVIEGLIYKEFKTFSIPDAKGGEWIYGLDWGYTDPMALVRCYVKDNKAQIYECFYQTSNTTQDLINFMNQEKVSKESPIYCDSAEKDRIIELQRAGFNALGSIKNVQAGISYVQSLKLLVYEYSINLIKSLRNYQYKQDKSGKWLDEPAHAYSHLVDAIRYCLYTHHMKNKGEMQVMTANTPYNIGVVDLGGDIREGIYELNDLFNESTD